MQDTNVVSKETVANDINVLTSVMSSIPSQIMGDVVGVMDANQSNTSGSPAMIACHFPGAVNP